MAKYSSFSSSSTERPLWVRQSAHVTKTLGFSRADFTQDSSHDLTRTSLWQVWNHNDALRSSKWSNDSSHMQNKGSSQSSQGLSVVGLGLVLLDLRSRQSVTRNVDHIVNSTSDPVVTVVISTSTVSCEVETWVWLQVSIDVTVVVFVHGSSHGWPTGSDSQHTFNIVSFKHLSSDRVNDDSINSEEWQSGCTWLGRNSTSQRSNQVGARLGLPVSVRNVTQALSDLLIVPIPDLGSNWFSDRTQSTQGAQIVLLDLCLSGFLEQSQCSWCNVEVGCTVFLNDLPETAVVWVSWSTFKDDGSAANSQWTVEGIRVTCNPTNVSRSEEDVFWLHVKHILSGEESTQQEPARAVDNTFWSTRGSGGVEHEKWVFGVHWHWGTHLLNGRTVFQTFVHDLLGVDGLATSFTLIAGDHGLTSSVADSVLDRTCRETCKDDRMDSSKTNNGQHGDQCFGGHWEINSHSITFFDSPALQNTSNLGDLVQQLTVSESGALLLVICLENDGSLVRVGKGMSINTVVARVQFSTNKPGRVTIGQRSSLNVLELLVPVQVLFGKRSKKTLRVFDRLLVQSFVVI
ncbi:hypothetical protein OGAPHI_005122 [Ogataea philodendri]|uniref:Uncharacterized protein n=1 Tax=Ogataea philodendri TaxID=1378263 RepID=A0A9P8T2J2_9ASCO|nr:uncharacterized protein OGAPHI_005122 [Ogataea philodendri]KAH3663721.1 hypothetical protein OGAPHI_005122 [Ogataea philodendri]